MEKHSHPRKSTGRERHKNSPKRNRATVTDFFSPWETQPAPANATFGIESWSKRQRKAAAGAPTRRSVKQEQTQLDALTNISQRCQAIEDLVLFIQESLGDVLPPPPPPSPSPPTPPVSSPEQIPLLQEAIQESDVEAGSTVAVADANDEEFAVNEVDTVADEPVDDVAVDLVPTDDESATEPSDDLSQDATEISDSSRLTPKPKTPVPIKLSYTQSNIKLERPYGGALQQRTEHNSNFTQMITSNMAKHIPLDPTQPSSFHSNGDFHDFEMEESRIRTQKRHVLAQTYIDHTKARSKYEGEYQKAPSQQEIILALEKAAPYKNHQSNGVTVINAEVDLRSRLVASVEAKSQSKLHSKHQFSKEELATGSMPQRTFPLSQLLPAVNHKLTNQRAQYSGGSDRLDSPCLWERDIVDAYGGVDSVKSRAKQEFLGPSPFRATQGRSPLHRGRDSRLVHTTSNTPESSDGTRKTRWPSSAVIRGDVRSSTEPSPRLPSARKTNVPRQLTLSMASENSLVNLVQ